MMLLSKLPSTRQKSALIQHPRRFFSRMDRLKSEFAEQASSSSKKQTVYFPFVTLALTGTSIFIYYKWQKMTPRQARSNFVFSETNFYNVGNYQSMFLAPLSYENNLFFYMNLPGLMYAGFMVERFCGPGPMIAAYLVNCGVSAAATTIAHRQLGFHKVQQRGRFSNTNGNMTLLLTAMFTSMAPGYKIYAGQYLSITFLYVLAFYGILFFTEHMSMEQMRAAGVYVKA